MVREDQRDCRKSQRHDRCRCRRRLAPRAGRRTSRTFASTFLHLRGLIPNPQAKRFKPNRAAYIPPAASYFATEDSKTLNEHQSVYQLARRLDKIELPSRAASALEGITAVGPKSRLSAWTMILRGDGAFRPVVTYSR